MAKYTPKEVSYPKIDLEYRIVTPAGITSCVFEDLSLARTRLKSCPPSWQIIMVRTEMIPMIDFKLASVA